MTPEHITYDIARALLALIEDTRLVAWLGVNNPARLQEARQAIINAHAAGTIMPHGDAIWEVDEGYVTHT